MPTIRVSIWLGCVGVGGSAFPFELLLGAQPVIQFASKRATACEEDLVSALANLLDGWRSTGSRSGRSPG